jgi:hypothetical protein
MDNTVQSAKEFWAYLKTPTAKGILKCSLAVSDYPVHSGQIQESSTRDHFLEENVSSPNIIEPVFI